MTDRGRLKEHLGNQVLYVCNEGPVDPAWKVRLLARYDPSRQLALALEAGPSPWIPFVALWTPLACMAVIVASLIAGVGPVAWFSGPVSIVARAMPVHGFAALLAFSGCFAAAMLWVTRFLRDRLSC